MTDLRLEVGKTYLTRKGLSGPIGPGHLVKIFGEVDVDTIEYNKGCRYFGSNNNFYTHDGRSAIELNIGDLIRLAHSSDFVGALVEEYVIPKDECVKSPKYIAADDPRFFMAAGNMYIDRRGSCILIDAVVHDDKTDYKVFGSLATGMMYTQTGVIDRTQTSMKDLAFQRI